MENLKNSNGSKIHWIEFYVKQKIDLNSCHIIFLITYAFDYSETRQGFDYWNAIRNKFIELRYNLKSELLTTC